MQARRGSPRSNRRNRLPLSPQHGGSARARVKVIRGDGTAIPQDRNFDLVVSIGVLHHIRESRAGHRCARIRAPCKPGGRCLSGSMAGKAMRLSRGRRTPARADQANAAPAARRVLCHVLDLAAIAYTALSRILPLPMRDYMQNVYGRLAPDKRTARDLRPAQSRPMRNITASTRRGRCWKTAASANVRTHHRHGYSWSVVGQK